MVAIGIDLGTTNCCMAVVHNGQLKVLENLEGMRKTPSVIGFVKNNVLIGNSAKKLTSRYPKNVIYGVKRLIGLKYTDGQVQKNAVYMPFDIIESEKKLKIAVKNAFGTAENYIPEQLSGILLQKLKSQAEARLDMTIDNVVITVPSYFNDSQRRATVDAGKIAGFKLVNLLDEPTAAAIHYGIDNKLDDGRIILVFDFGGGTFDISIIKYNNNEFDILLIDGASKLGGEDIDNKLVKYISDKCQLNSSNNNYKRTLARLKELCENAKIELSTKHETELYIADTETEIFLTRKKFNDLIDDIIDKTINIVDKCLKKHNISNIDNILLVGGSTRIPLVAEKLINKFKIPLNENTNADEAVAYGAAIYASKIYDNQYPNLKTVKINQDALGVETAGGKMSFLIEKFKKLPAQNTKKYKTANEKQKQIIFKVFCGDDQYTKNNKFLGDFCVSGIKSGPKGAIVEVVFQVDENGILNVSVKNQKGISTQMNQQINVNTGFLTDEEIENYRIKLNKEIGLSEKNEHFKLLQYDLNNKNIDSDIKKQLLKLDFSEENYYLLKQMLNDL